MIVAKRFQILISAKKKGGGAYNPEISSIHFHICDSPGRPRGFGQFINRPGREWGPLEAPGV